MAELETAEAWCRRQETGLLVAGVIDPEQVEARDKAVALRAKRELLDELIKRAEVHSRTGHGSGRACVLAIVDMQERYPHE